MFSRLFKTPKSSLQLFRKNQAAMLPNDAESPQFPSENFSSLPIIWKVGLGVCSNSITYRPKKSCSEDLPSMIALPNMRKYRHVFEGNKKKEGR